MKGTNCEDLLQPPAKRSLFNPNIILSTLLSGITLHAVYSALTDAEQIVEKISMEQYYSSV